MNFVNLICISLFAPFPRIPFSLSSLSLSLSLSLSFSLSLSLSLLMRHGANFELTPLLPRPILFSQRGAESVSGGLCDLAGRAAVAVSVEGADADKRLMRPLWWRRSSGGTANMQGWRPVMQMQKSSLFPNGLTNGLSLNCC